MNHSNSNSSTSASANSNLQSKESSNSIEKKHFDLVINQGSLLIFKDDKFQFLNLNIGVNKGKIVSLSDKILTGTKEILAKNLIVLPGIIDSQVHFREPGMTHKEDIESGSKAAALGGITSYFEMPNVIPATTNENLLLDKITIAEQKSWVNFGFFIGACLENLDSIAHLEKLPFCPGLKVFMGSSTGNLLVEDDLSLEKILRTGSRRVIVHSEDEYRLRSRKQIAIDGKSAHFHPVWRDEFTALQATQRLIHLAEKTQRPVHVLHVTTAEEMAFLEKHKSIASVEVLPQHLTFSSPECYERLGTLAQQNPPIRSRQHQEALWKAIEKGIVDVIGSDHAPHTLEEKAKEYPSSPSGLPGVQTLLPLMLNHVNQGRLSLQKLIQLVCENPRWVFGCLSKGRIEEGLDADFTIVDMKAERTIENKKMLSRCGWTPYDGMKVQGWPIYTIVQGTLVMAEDKLEGSPSGRGVLFENKVALK